MQRELGPWALDALDVRTGVSAELFWESIPWTFKSDFVHELNRNVISWTFEGDIVHKLSKNCIPMYVWGSFRTWSVFNRVYSQTI